MNGDWPQPSPLQKPCKSQTRKEAGKRFKRTLVTFTAVRCENVSMTRRKEILTRKIFNKIGRGGGGGEVGGGGGGGRGKEDEQREEEVLMLR